MRGLGWSSVVNHLRCKRSQIFVSQIKFIECRIIQIYETRRRGGGGGGGGWGEGQTVVWAGAAVEAWEAKQENGERSRRE